MANLFKLLFFSKRNKRRFAMKKNITSTTEKTKFLRNLRGLDPERAGIDIGASSVFVCIADTQGRQEVREYPTFTSDLKNMANWLKQNGIKSVAMESTGVYWIPIFEILDPMGFEVVLANAYHLKNVPGRKTDVKDCQWIQQLHSNGLLSASFRPSDEFVRLRSFVRQRRGLFERASIHVQLMHKALTQMNIQLHLVLSDLTGKTGLQIIQAMIAGERDPNKLASHRQSPCRKSEAEIAKALEGTWREEHLFALRQAYEAYEFYHRQVMECEQAIHSLLAVLSSSNHFHKPSSTVAARPEVQSQLHAKKQAKKTTYNRSPYHFDVVAMVQPTLPCGIDLTAIPGIDANILLAILSETGTDMSKWRTVKHFCSWLGLCPGSKISGGKVLSSKTKPSNNRVAHALRLAANTLHRSKTALGAFFRRMRARLGAPKAITATAHKLARILYRMLKYGKTYEELGAGYYEHRYRERVLRNLTKTAVAMGYQLVPSAQA
jgi:transposase